MPDMDEAQPVADLKEVTGESESADALYHKLGNLVRRCWPPKTRLEKILAYAAGLPEMMADFDPANKDMDDEGWHEIDLKIASDVAGTLPETRLEWYLWMLGSSSEHSIIRSSLSHLGVGKGSGLIGDEILLGDYYHEATDTSGGEEEALPGTPASDKPAIDINDGGEHV